MDNTTISELPGRGNVRSIGRPKSEGKDEESKPIVVNQALRAAVEEEFSRIESIEDSIKVMREDIKEAIASLAKRGLRPKAIKLALARRKMAVDGDLESVDESLSIICGIGSLGIQGDLFALASIIGVKPESGNGGGAGSDAA